MAFTSIVSFSKAILLSLLSTTLSTAAAIENMDVAARDYPLPPPQTYALPPSPPSYPVHLPSDFDQQAPSISNTYPINQQVSYSNLTNAYCLPNTPGPSNSIIFFQVHPTNSI
ncbi:uncharacterized protein RAG0_04106 [Rhynchosporium agropyri]|uniref:Uncharacterized protein n=1 Tax=Rhynchosporium agropyri TaxID=914238 RepID=A0A1E1K7M0_9HELO|nr:uncharacterized protein RAG0_04106 [Rhynchosporium agropyri]